MTTFTLDEITRNAILAALDERAARLDGAIKNSSSIKDTFNRNGYALPEDVERALVWNIAALHETKQAREVIGEAPPADHPANATAWTEGELSEAYGR